MLLKNQILLNATTRRIKRKVVNSHHDNDFRETQELPFPSFELFRKNPQSDGCTEKTISNSQLVNGSGKFSSSCGSAVSRPSPSLSDSQYLTNEVEVIDLDCTPSEVNINKEW